MIVCEYLCFDKIGERVINIVKLNKENLSKFTNGVVLSSP